MRFRVHVRMAPGVFDPQAATVERILRKLSYPVEKLELGKTFEFTLNEGEEDASKKANEIAKKILTNPVLEIFEVERVE